MFEVRDLKRYFKKVKAVDGISFAFGKGDVMGFIGPNGAGKTTSMRVMASIDVPTAGDCLVDGRSILAYPEYLYDHVGFMPDFTGTYPNMNVFEYIDFFTRGAGLRGPSRKARVEQILEFSGLNDIQDKQVESLSKGMKQRLGLGRMLVHDPDYLILDEPAAGLDPRARIEVRELLRVLAQTDKGILVSSHILTELAEVCNSIAIVDRGRILRCGTVNEIKKMLKSELEIVIEYLPSCDTGALERFLLTRPESENVKVAETRASFLFTGKEEQLPAFLAILFQQGFPVTGVRKTEMSMEEIFMQVTGEQGNSNGQETGGNE